MFHKEKPPFSAEQVQPKWEELVRLERRLRRNVLLCRILQPVGTVLFSLNLLLAALNFVRCIGGELLQPFFSTVPLFVQLTDGLPHETVGSCIGFLLWFGVLIPAAVCGAITGVVYLLDRRKPQAERPLTGSRAQCAKALANQGETVYMLRRSMPRLSVFVEAGVVTALMALPVLLRLIEIAKTSDPSILQLTVGACLLLVCLFVLYWVFTGLLEAFSLLLSLFYFSPGEWTLYKQHRELDAYWESVDPDEFARRERAAADAKARKRA